MRDATLVWSDELATYRFGASHPLDPRRLELTLTLIRELGLLPDGVVSAPLDVREDVLEGVHSPEYVAAVRRASRGALPAAELAAWGLGTADVPVVEGMHESALRVAGSTLAAAHAVMSGRSRRAFGLAGGLHHARRSEAAGFCIYNDLAVAIRWLQREHGARVLYLDIDAHHGDGVQWIFYEDADVLTLSLHESGAYLFPGTGFIDELGTGDGHGLSVNVPLEAHTADASWLRCFEMVVPETAAAFRPDVIVLQAGCDAHRLDPLTHLRCTTRMMEASVRAVIELADEHCEGRLIVTGGGGYAIHDVVPRAWTLVWAALLGQEPDDALPPAYVRLVEAEAGRAVGRTLRDAPAESEPSPGAAGAEAAAARTNAVTVDALRRRVLPLLTGWGMAF
jgi:acetoin utilization protein AcuC